MSVTMQDELLWAASWLYVATKLNRYRMHVMDEGISGSVAEFSWDLKYAGAQILLTGVNILFYQALVTAVPYQLRVTTLTIFLKK